MNNKNKINKKSQDKKKTPKARKKKAVGKKNLLRKTLFLSLIWGFSFCFLTLIYFSYDIPSADDLINEKQPEITILDEKGRLIADLSPNHQGSAKFIELKDIPNHLKNAVLAAEDHRFYEHFGIDFIGLLRASFANLLSGKIMQGGSTITQQLVKISLLSHKKTFKRKFQEFIIALNVERKFTKDQILELYLNRIYLGPGVYGVGAASKFYFSQNVQNISISQSAILAGLIRSPANLSPSKNEEASASRGFRVLEKMYEYGFINYQQFDFAQNENVIIDQTIIDRDNFYFTDWILNKIKDDVAFEGDIIVQSTLDLDLQKNAQNILNKFIDENSHLNVNQGAIIAIDSKGAVKAMVGGRKYQESPYNRALYAQRQPGSTFKLFVYLAALEAGIKRDAIFEDEPITITDAGKKWSPQNYDRKFHGPLTMEESFARSINVVTVKIAEKIGISNVVNLAKRLGIQTEINNYPSIVLGVSNVTLSQLAGAYAAVENGGYHVTPFPFYQIKKQNGRLIHKAEIEQNKVLDDEIVTEMKKMLNAAVKFGTAKEAQIPGLEDEIFAKTGTSQNHKDANFVGFTNGLTIAVWLGNDGNEPMKKVTGGKIPAKIWKSLMEKHLNR